MNFGWIGLNLEQATRVLDPNLKQYADQGLNAETTSFHVSAQIFLFSRLYLLFSFFHLIFFSLFFYL